MCVCLCASSTRAWESKDKYEMELSKLASLFRTSFLRPMLRELLVVVMSAGREMEGWEGRRRGNGGGTVPSRACSKRFAFSMRMNFFSFLDVHEGSNTPARKRIFRVNTVVTPSHYTQM